MVRKGIVVSCFLLLIICTLASAPVACNAGDEGNFPGAGIFDNSLPLTSAEAESPKGNNALTIMLSGLVISLFLITGAARSYLQLHDRIKGQVAHSREKMAAIVNESAVIHDRQLHHCFQELEENDKQIERLEKQLQIDREV